MEEAERFRLISKYRTPRFRIGGKVFCEVRGQVVITGMTEAPILWPIAKGGRGRSDTGTSSALDLASTKIGPASEQSI